MIEFFMPMIPPTITYQEAKIHVVKGKPFKYEPMELKTARQKLKAYLAQHRIEKPFDCPLELRTIWAFPRDGKHREGTWMDRRPDTDNLQKLLKDCMTSVGFWRDDCLVCREIVEKIWSDTSGIYIMISELPGTYGEKPDDDNG